jgi:hypothetical protein
MGRVRQTVHVPLGGDAKRARCLPCQPVSRQGGPGSVVMLPAAERDVLLPHRGGADGVSSVRCDGRRCSSQPVDYRPIHLGRLRMAAVAGSCLTAACYAATGSTSMRYHSQLATGRM